MPIKQPSKESTDYFGSEIHSKLNYLSSTNYDLLTNIYEYTDMVCSDQNLFSCSKGCSACCHIDVQITELEANYINLKSGKGFRNKVMTINNRTPCPFLDNDICTIYKYRPLACRKHFTNADPSLCENPKSKVPLFFNSQLYKISYFLSINLKWKDIRDWF